MTPTPNQSGGTGAVKPSIHEIAAMPFPASVNAIREHYDPKWGKDVPDGPRKFRVRAEYTISGTIDEVIEAEDKDEAEDIARECAADDAYAGHVELDFVKITEIEE